MSWWEQGELISPANAPAPPPAVWWGNDDPVSAPDAETSPTYLSVAKVFGSHGAHAFGSIPDAPSEMGKLVGRTIKRATGDNSPDVMPEPANPGKPKDLMSAILGAYINQNNAQGPLEGPGADKAVTAVIGPRIEPKNIAERLAATAGDYAPAAVGSPGLLTGAARVAASAAGGEGAKAGTQALGGGDLAQAWAQIGGGALGFAGGKTFGDPLLRSADNSLNSVGKAVTDQLSRVQVDPNVVGMSGGNVRIGKAPPPAPPPPPPINRKLVSQSKMTPEKFDETMAPYDAQGVEPFEFQAYGPRAGVAKAAALSRMSGEGGTLSKEALDPARNDLQNRALTALDTMADGQTSKWQAQQQLEGLKQEIAPQWGPTLAQAVNPETMAALQELRSGLPEKLQTSIDNQLADINRARAVTGDPPLNDGQIFQETKRIIQGAASDLYTNPDKIGTATAVGGIDKAYRDTLHGENGIPGYAELDARFSDISNAEKGIDLGRQFWGPGVAADEAIARYNGADPAMPATDLTQGAQRAGVASKIGESIRGKTEGYNPGNIARNPDQIEKLQGFFGPEKADPFIANQRLIAKDAGDYNQVSPDRGSPTAGLGAEMFADTAEAIRTIKGGPVHWAGKAVEAIVDRVANHPIEHQRNILIKQLLERVTPERRAQIRQQLEDIQAEQQRAALAQALAAGAGAKPQDPSQQIGQ